MPYQVATGHNNAAGLTTIVPQPATSEIEPGLLRQGGDGLFYEDGFKRTTLKWSRLTSAQLAALYTAFGWSATVASSAVTLRLKDNSDRDFANCNVIADRPRARYVLGYWENVESDIHHMDAL